MRTRALTLSALLALGLLGPAAAASADICYDVSFVLNGDSVIAEADCIEA